MDVKPADLTHVSGIKNLILEYSSNGVMLERSQLEISNSIHNFHVALNASGEVVGCVSIYIYSQELSEIRSLGLKKEYRGKGIGKELLKASLANAKLMQIEKVFALTLKVDFFIKNGFAKINKESLPEKIWQDCSKCPMYSDCKETALILMIK